MSTSGINLAPSPTGLLVHSAGDWKVSTITGNVSVNDNVFTVNNLNGSEFKTSVTFPGEVNIADDLVVAQDFRTAGNFVASGNSSMTGSLTVNGAITTYSNMTVDASLDVKQDLNVDGKATIDGKLTTASDVQVGGNAVVNGNLTVLGAVSTGTPSMTTLEPYKSDGGIIIMGLSNVSGPAIIDLLDAKGDPTIADGHMFEFKADGIYSVSGAFYGSASEASDPSYVAAYLTIDGLTTYQMGPLTDVAIPFSWTFYAPAGTRVYYTSTLDNVPVLSGVYPMLICKLH